MEPEQLREGEKVAVPEAWKADQQKANERRELMGQWREHLSAKQRERLDEDPYANFSSGMSVELIKSLTSAEREELAAHEEIAHARHKPLAREKDDRRRSFVQAGGSAEDFDASWEAYGRHIHIEDVAAANRARATQESAY